jgi:hypothetical protein
MSKVMVWVHGDSLRPGSAALAKHPEARRVFVFDDRVIEGYRLSLKRIVFIYESLLEIEGIEIRRGDVAAELAEAARESGVTRIVTTESVAPGFARISERLRRDYRLELEVLTEEPFAGIGKAESERMDLKRFSRFWQPIKSRALNLNRSLW